MALYSDNFFDALDYKSVPEHNPGWENYEPRNIMTQGELAEAKL